MDLEDLNNITDLIEFDEATYQLLMSLLNNDSDYKNMTDELNRYVNRNMCSDTLNAKKQILQQLPIQRGCRQRRKKPQIIKQCQRPQTRSQKKKIDNNKH